ncbi:MAG: ribbon-helix-helix protein, CopG family [Acidobacteria bacterium]|nr:ribbon-helix-helix protein, CopG family [Acidobacteriota bacterium]MBI3472945.1 ribbon-helix-helix protein, CopG family [Candidatus Solibacter usitatus]
MKMKARRAAAGGATEADATSVRASISLPPEVYETLEEIARQKKVSLAWVVRDAAETYIADKWPLLRKTGS